MFNLTLVTPDKKLLAGEEIEEVFVPGERGELNILPGHAPLVTLLVPGVLKYRLKGQSTVHRVAVSDGYCQVNPQGVNVMAETAERPDEIDGTLAETSIKNLETQMMTQILDSETLAKTQIKLARERARLVLVEFRGTEQ